VEKWKKNYEQRRYLNFKRKRKKELTWSGRGQTEENQYSQLQEGHRRKGGLKGRRQRQDKRLKVNKKEKGNSCRGLM